MVSSGKFLALVFLFVLLAGVVFLLFGNKFELTKAWHEKVFGVQAQSVVVAVSAVDTLANKEIVEPPASQEWCKIQEVIVPTDRETYARDQIIGWDNIKRCCVRKLSGYNCALHKESYFEYCYSAHIAGEIVWAAVEGYFVDANKYEKFISDLDKVAIENKPCSDEIYPALLKSVSE